MANVIPTRRSAITVDAGNFQFDLIVASSSTAFSLENDTGTGAWPHYCPAKYIVPVPNPFPHLLLHSVPIPAPLLHVSSPFPPRYRNFCHHPHPITAESCKQEHPIPRRREDDGYFLTLCPYVLRFYLVYVNSFYFLHFARNVIVLLITGCAVAPALR